MLNCWPRTAHTIARHVDNRFLAARPELAEVNFWQPSGGRQFRVLTPGEPFLFKTHYPHNRVVGGSFFTGWVPMKVSEAWEYFGRANGAGSLDRMLSRRPSSMHGSQLTRR